jgi:hypothetical protein
MYLLACALTATAQTDMAGLLTVTVVEGAGAFNDIRKKIGRNLTVEIRDERGQVVEGAQVTFQLPLNGPGGTYSGNHVYDATTDNMGRARTSGFSPNGVEGRFQIRINASHLSKSGATITNQSNTSAGGFTTGLETKHSRKKKVVLAILGAAVVGGVVAGTRGSPTPPASVSLGAITVGGPR